MKGTSCNLRLTDAFTRKNVLILAHRGVSCANIVDNTLESYDAALRQGADLVEVDVCATLDGDLFALHDGMEPVVLGIENSIVNMHTDEVRALRYLNRNHIRIDHPINTFDEVLSHLKGRCLINLDRCWVCWEPVFEAVRRHGMEDQILFKSPPEEKYLAQMAAQPVPYLYMPVVWYPEEVALAESYDLNLAAVEVIGYREDAPIMQPDYLASLRDKGYARLISSLTLGNPVHDPAGLAARWGAAGSRMAGALVDGNIYLAGGHDDDTAILGDPDAGWGWLVARGFNILQTDWSLALSLYLKEAGYNPT